LTLILPNARKINMRGTTKKEKKNMRAKSLDEFEDNPLNFKARVSDRLRVERVVRKLDMSRSEVCRRALRIGLDALEKAEANFPGGAVLSGDDTLNA
jgi:hypothetical protein